MKVTFRLVRIGELFSCNGNLYTKQSSRTAKMMGYDQRTFYFSQTDDCSI